MREERRELRLRSRRTQLRDQLGKSAATGTDSSRFTAAGAQRSFWLRTKQGFLAEGLPLLREALAGLHPTNASEPPTLILESNSVLQFVQPSLYFAVIDPSRDDFKDSARIVLDRADALVLRGADDTLPSEAPWMKLPRQLLNQTPQFTKRKATLSLSLFKFSSGALWKPRRRRFITFTVPFSSPNKTMSLTAGANPSDNLLVLV